jgi:hypothetical protein
MRCAAGYVATASRLLFRWLPHPSSQGDYDHDHSGDKHGDGYHTVTVNRFFLVLRLNVLVNP